MVIKKPCQILISSTINIWHSFAILLYIKILFLVFLHFKPADLLTVKLNCSLRFVKFQPVSDKYLL